jgi:MFS family permease
MQYPMGWISDRMDRRVLIVASSTLSGLVGVAGYAFAESFLVLMLVSGLVGGLSQPLYALLIAYTNDYLAPEDMPSASGGLIFLNGLGAIGGPPLAGLAMSTIGPGGYWLMMSVFLFLNAAYGLWRMTRRPSIYAADREFGLVSYPNILPGASPVAVETAQELYGEATGASEPDTKTAPTGDQDR